MGRLPLSEESKRAMFIRIIRATEELITAEGLQNTTLRAISNKVQCNSAALYKYFSDLDELLLYACIKNFNAYVDELSANQQLRSSFNGQATYLLTWELFCKHSFANPECAHHLFFSKHSTNLKKIITTYFQLFPQDVAATPLYLLPMVTTASLKSRNWKVLRPLLKGKISNRQAVLVNDLTIAYFQLLLNEKIIKGSLIKNEEQTTRMLQACRYLLATAAAQTS